MEKESTHVGDELVMELAHMAGRREERGEIYPDTWDDLKDAIDAAIDEYYEGNPPELDVKSVAVRVFRERLSSSAMLLKNGHL